MATAIDRLMGLEWLKKKVDSEHRKAKEDAEEMLARKRDEDGTMELTSVAFGPDAGSYKYSKTRKKKVVEFNLASADELREWVMDNQDAAMAYVLDRSEDFAREWFEKTGEVPEGVSRVEYEEPAKIGAPKLYRFDPEEVESKLGANLLEGMGKLLGDGNE